MRIFERNAAEVDLVALDAAAARARRSSAVSMVATSTVQVVAAGMIFSMPGALGVGFLVDVVYGDDAGRGYLELEFEAELVDRRPRRRRCRRDQPLVS